MKKSTILLIFLISFVTCTKAQQENETRDHADVNNTFYLAYGGAGIYFSLMYERHLIKTDNIHVGAKAGMGTSFSSVLFPSEFNFPVGAYIFYGKNKGHIEFSLSMSNYLLEQYDYAEDQTIRTLKNLIVPSLGYRFQKKQGGVMFKAGVSPIINFNKTTNVVTPWLDVGIGWGF